MVLVRIVGCVMSSLRFKHWTLCVGAIPNSDLYMRCLYLGEVHIKEQCSICKVIQEEDSGGKRVMAEATPSGAGHEACFDTEALVCMVVAFGTSK